MPTGPVSAALRLVAVGLELLSSAFHTFVSGAEVLESQGLVWNFLEIPLLVRFLWKYRRIIGNLLG